MSSGQLNLAIVGCGDIAGYTAWFARLNRRIRLAACCDVSQQRADAFARRHKITNVFTEFAQLLECASFDALYLAVPHYLHYPKLCQAIDRGLPTLVEKPLTRTLTEGIQVVGNGKAGRIKVGVNYQYRYDSGCYSLARAMQRDQLGRIASVRINVPWRRESTYFTQSAWHAGQATAGGGTLITQGSHFLDVVLWGLDSRVVSVAGYTSRFRHQDVEVEGVAQGIVETEDGTLIQINSMMAASSEQAVSIEVYGEKGTAIYSPSPMPRIRFKDVKVKKEKPPHWGVHALQRSLEGFRTWVTGGQPYLTPAAQSLPVLAAVEAIYASAQSGRREPVADWQQLPTLTSN